jgi:hypothetical protein
METTSTSAFARLLATENIRVRHLAEAETASFDVVDRVLTLPKWRNMSEELYDMLIGHEVAHALWTPGDLAEDGEHLAAAVEIDPDNPMRAMGFLNVVEDARIERLIKDKYPGLRRDFVSGYRWLWDNMDLFQTVITEQGGVSNMMLTDRLNLHFKLGIMGILAIPFFTDEERSFVSRIEGAETWDDVMDITRDLYEHEKNAAQNRPQSAQDQWVEGQDGEPRRSLDADGVSKPVTEDMLGAGLSDLRDERVSYQEGLSFLPDADLDKIIVDADEIATMIFDPNIGIPENSHYCRNDAIIEMTRKAYDAYRGAFNEWVRTETKTVNYLVKQFEMRKAADEHKRTMITKSGRLDTVKMVNHRWSEDIFAKNTIVREGKNHGFVFMIDWSGSMHHNIPATVRQTLLLCMFCQKAGVPFDVYAFSSNTKDTNGGWNPRYDWQGDTSTTPKDYFSTEDPEGMPLHMGPMQMLHFMSSSRGRKQTLEDMYNLFFLADAMSGGSYDGDVAAKMGGNYAYIHRSLELGGTPLDEGIICLHKILPAFRRRHGVQVLNCVILTDGDGCTNLGSTIYNPTIRRNFGDHPSHKPAQDRPTSTTSLLLSLKETTGCNLIGMYLYAGKHLHNCHGWYAHGGGYWDKFADLPQKDKDAQKAWSKENFAIANGHKAFAYDEAYIINAMVNIEDDIEIDADASHAKMRNAFVKGMAQRSMSRTLTNRLVDRIAC